jgi:hypothetical protein
MAVLVAVAVLVAMLVTVPAVAIAIAGARSAAATAVFLLFTTALRVDGNLAVLQQNATIIKHDCRSHI